MTPERWSQVKRVLFPALECETDEDCDRVVRVLCDGDEELEREVRSILAHGDDPFRPPLPR